MEGRDFRKIEIVIEALRRHKEFQELLEGVNPFLIYRTDTGASVSKRNLWIRESESKSE